MLACLIASPFSQADQNNPELDGLFDSLQQAETNSEARQIENTIWQHWLRAPDENANALLSQISMAMSQRDYQIALKLSNQLVDSSPDYAEGWNKRATVQYLLGNHQESVADIRETLVREPRHFGALSGLGLIFMAQDNPTAALKAFERVLKLSPASDNAKGSIARARSEIGDDI